MGLTANHFSFILQFPHPVTKLINQEIRLVIYFIKQCHGGAKGKIVSQLPQIILIHLISHGILPPWIP